MQRRNPGAAAGEGSGLQLISVYLLQQCGQQKTAAFTD